MVFNVLLNARTFTPLAPPLNTTPYFQTVSQMTRVPTLLFSVRRNAIRVFCTKKKEKGWTLHMKGTDVKYVR